MSLYCLVKDNAVVQNPGTLPENYAGISNIKSLSDTILKDLGWYSCILPERVFNPAIQNQLPDTYVIGEDSVAVVYNVENKTQEELNIIAAQIVANEITDLKADLKAALVWQFRMIEALWETGVTKGIWGASDIANVELKQKYVEWKTKLTRLAELGE